MSQALIVSLINFWAPIYGIPSNVAVAVAQAESSFNPNAVGSIGEIGLFQIRSEYVKEYTKKQLFDPEINILVGLKKLKEAKNACVHKKDIEWLTCYNYGINAAKRVHHPEMFPYVRNVKKIMIANNLEELSHE